MSRREWIIISKFLGIDLGTSSLKVLVLDENGCVKASASTPYATLCKQSGYAEQEPETWWEALKDSLANLQKNHRISMKHICGIGFSGQMHGTVVLDQSKNILRPAIIHCDARTGQEVTEIKGLLGRQVEEILKNPIGPGILLPSLLWIKKHEQEIYEKIRYVMLPKDYLRFRLTGQILTDYSDASATLAFDLNAGSWAERILDMLEKPLEIFPVCRNSMDEAGTVTRSAAGETGLMEGTKVVLGGADQVMQSVGCKALFPGEATVNIGSGGQICVQTKQPYEAVSLGMNTFSGIVWGKWYAMGATTSAGSSLKWLNQILGQNDFDVINGQVDNVRPGSNGLIFLPYLNGERCPHVNADISGVFWGLNYMTGRAEMTRSVMEGVTYALRSCLDICRKSGLSITGMTALGGGSRSKPWLQMQADVFGIPLQRTVHHEQAAFGAAVMAAVGCGFYKNTEEACGFMVRFQDEMIEPNMGNHRIYEEYYEIYQEIYAKGKDTLEAVTRLGRRQ